MIMNTLYKIPVLRFFLRLLKYINKSAPLDEFSGYEEYWKKREFVGSINQVLDRYVIISKEIRSEESVLDFGCGDGAFLAYIQKNRSEVRCAGVDISYEAVNKAKNKGVDAYNLSHNEKLESVVPKDWDVITLMEVLEHYADAEDIMRQVIEMRPNRVFVTIPNVGCLKHRLRLAVGGRFPITSIHFHMKEHIRFWTYKDFVEWTGMNGLRVVNIWGQFDKGDNIVRFFVKRFPALFATRVVYELAVKNK